MEQAASTSGTPGTKPGAMSGQVSVVDQAKAVADTVSNKTQEAVEQAREIGTEALDQVDTWLRPVGLSIKERPVAALLVIGGIAAAAGALWMSRPQRSRMDEVVDRLTDLSRRVRW